MMQTGRLGDDTTIDVNVKVRGFEHVVDEHRKYDDGETVAQGYIPQRGTKGSAGYDLCTPISFEINPGETYMLWTNIKAYMLQDEVLWIDVRSSVGIKKHVYLENVIPIIDSDYFSNPKNDGNIGLCLRNNGEWIVSFEKGDAICQGLFMKYLITDDDCPKTEERVGGIGSTTKKTKR